MINCTKIDVEYPIQNIINNFSFYLFKPNLQVMIVLEDEKQEIINFVINSIKAFKAQKGKYNSIGIYCCPWSGWISLSFNINKSISDTSYNCPDFDVVEFELLDLEHWEKEYENETPTYIYEGRTTNSAMNQEMKY